MGAEVFEVGLFKPDARDGEAIMLPRVWDRDALLDPFRGCGTKTATAETYMSGPAENTTSAWWTT